MLWALGYFVLCHAPIHFQLKSDFKVDMRTKSFDVPPQEVLTKDSVTVTVDAVIYYRVRDANGKSY